MKVTYLQQYCSSRIGLTGVPWYDLELGEMMECYPGGTTFRRTEEGIQLRYGSSKQWDKRCWRTEESRAKWQAERKDPLSLIGTIVSCEVD